MKLDLVDRQILTLLNEGKSSIGKEIAPSLIPAVNVSTVRIRVNKLIEEGYMTKIATGQYGITKKGEDAISPEQTENLTAIYPPLGLIPDYHYRAFVELIYAAIVARTDAITPDHHFVFVIAGRPRETWKTRLGRFICNSLDLDPETHIAYLPAESGRSLFTRKDSSGATTFKREILNQPIVVLDEFLEADKKVRDILRLYTSANLFISYENEKLKLTPVPIITLNPKIEKTNLYDKLGLKPSELARSIVLYADNISDLPVDDFAAHSDSILVAAQSKIMTIPPHKENCEKYRDEIIQLVKTCRKVTPEFGQSPTSYESIIQLCSGMTAFVEDAETAIKITLRDLFIVQETTGWVRENWHNVINNFSLERTQRELYGEHLIFETIKERVKDIEIDLAQLKRDMADLKLSGVKDMPTKLEELIDTIEYFGEVVRAKCPYQKDGYCMFFCSEEKPDEEAIPDKFVDVNGNETYNWYAKATHLRCGLCPRNLTMAE